MNLRDDDEYLKSKGMCFKYSDLSEEEKLVENLLVEKEEKNNELDVMEAMNYQLNNTNQESFKKWFEEYQKQPIEINEDKVRNYLEEFNQLKLMIKYRKTRILTGEIKPESKNLELDKIPSLDFLKESNIDKNEFLFKVDYKLREIDFYSRTLRYLLENLRMYGLLVYQYIVLKYIVKLEDEQIEKLLPYRDIKHLDSISISYLTNKLVEESKRELES